MRKCSCLLFSFFPLTCEVSPPFSLEEGQGAELSMYSFFPFENVAPGAFPLLLALSSSALVPPSFLIPFLQSPDYIESSFYVVNSPFFGRPPFLSVFLMDVSLFNQERGVPVEFPKYPGILHIAPFPLSGAIPFTNVVVPRSPEWVHYICLKWRLPSVCQRAFCPPPPLFGLLLSFSFHTARNIEGHFFLCETGDRSPSHGIYPLILSLSHAEAEWKGYLFTSLSCWG